MYVRLSLQKDELLPVVKFDNWKSVQDILYEQHQQPNKLIGSAKKEKSHIEASNKCPEAF